MRNINYPEFRIAPNLEASAILFFFFFLALQLIFDASKLLFFFVSETDLAHQLTAAEDVHDLDHPGGTQEA